MTKNEFLARLRARLSDLPPDEVDERLNFYSEMIDDRMEEGLSEEEAVAAIGRAGREEASRRTPTEETMPTEETAPAPRRRMSAPTVTLLALGSPVWLALLISAFAVVLSLYAALWSAVISVWAAALSVAVCAVGGTLGGPLLICLGGGALGVALFGAGVVCIGLAVFLFYGSLAATRGTIFLTRRTARLVCNRFGRRTER